MMENRIFELNLECGMLTCIHAAGGYCTNFEGCDLYERSLKQED